jgi:hypothetical protein
MAGSLLSRLFTRATEALDQRFRWYTLPLPLEILILIGLRMRLRERNLYDTSSTVQRPPKPEGVRHLTARTVDGTFNDLDHPPMGSAKTRFGRNVPLEHTYPDNDWALLNPNPRTVSRELLTRDSFRPATTLNLLAAAWLQFMIRDWFSHGKSEKENPWKLELSKDDPWPQERPMHILRTRKDPTRSPHDTSPPTYLNTETHWWDGSQIYGSNAETQAMVRSGEDGKLVVDPDGSMPDALIAQASQDYCYPRPPRPADWHAGQLVGHRGRADLQALRTGEPQRGDQRDPRLYQEPFRGPLLHHGGVRRRLPDAPPHT